MDMRRRSFLGFLGATALAPVVAKLAPTLATPPSLPTIPSPKPVGVTVSWNKVEQAIGYRIYRSTSDEVGELIAEVMNPQASFLDRDITPGQGYHYRLSAIYQKDESSWSESA